MGLFGRNDIRLRFRNSLDRCNGIITGGFDFSFRSRCLDVIFAGVHCSRQSRDAVCIVFALFAGIERSFDNRDSRISQLGNFIFIDHIQCIVGSLIYHFQIDCELAAILSRFWNGNIRNVVIRVCTAVNIIERGFCQRVPCGFIR